MMTIAATIQTNSTASTPTETAPNPNAPVPTECAFTNPNSATAKMIAKTTPTNYFAISNAMPKNSNATVPNTAFTNVGDAMVTATVPMDPTKKIAPSVPAPQGNSHVNPPKYASMPSGFAMVKTTVRMAPTRTQICA